MKKSITRMLVGITFLFTTLTMLSSCGRESSPEGRMSMKLEDLHKEMIDSLKQQNRAILDSLSSIRAELRELKQLKGQ